MNIEKHGNRWRVTEDRDGIRYRVSVDHKPSEREARDLIHERIREAEPPPAEGCASDGSMCRKEVYT